MTVTLVPAGEAGVVAEGRAVPIIGADGLSVVAKVERGGLGGINSLFYRVVVPQGTQHHP